MRNLRWIEGSAAGVAVPALSGRLSALHVLPEGLLILIGAVNLSHASYSFSRASRLPRRIALLVLANGPWAAVSLGLAITFAG